jgi:hypothetical protein
VPLGPVVGHFRESDMAVVLDVCQLAFEELYVKVFTSTGVTGWVRRAAVEVVSDVEVR